MFLKLSGRLEVILTSACGGGGGSLLAAGRAGVVLRVTLAPAQGCRETKMRDSVMAGPEECLTVIIFDDIITAQSDPSPGS